MVIYKIKTKQKNFLIFHDICIEQFCRIVFFNNMQRFLAKPENYTLQKSYSLLVIGKNTKIDNPMLFSSQWTA